MRYGYLLLLPQRISTNGMIQALIQIQNGHKIITKILSEPVNVHYSHFSKGIMIERFKTEEEAAKSVNDWNESIKRMQSGETFEIDPLPTDIDPDKISDQSKELIAMVLKSKNDDDWLLVIQAHNKEKWSQEKYCCLSDILKLKRQLSKANVL